VGLTTTHSSVADTGNSPIEIGPDTTSVGSDSVINVNFPAGVREVTIEGVMRGIEKPVTALVSVKSGQVLTAKILPEDSIANVRFSHIIFANGDSDGPFGRDLSRKIPRDGICKLIIAENQMQGEEWKGRFKLTIRLD